MYIGMQNKELKEKMSNEYNELAINLAHQLDIAICLIDSEPEKAKAELERIKDLFLEEID